MVVLIPSVVIETTEDCTNAGPCCYSCPCFDSCDQHYDEVDDA